MSKMNNSESNPKKHIEINDASNSYMSLSEILASIKSIDRIIVVDDVRKYDHDDIMKMREEFDRKDMGGKENDDK